MNELKAEIVIHLRNIKTGRIIYTEKAQPFDLYDIKSLKKTLASMFYSINSMRIADEKGEDN